MIPREEFICLTTCWRVEQAKIVCIGLCLAKYLAILPVSVRHTNKSTLLSSAICVAVVHSMSSTVPALPFSIPIFLRSWYAYSWSNTFSASAIAFAKSTVASVDYLPIDVSCDRTRASQPSSTDCDTSDVCCLRALLSPPVTIASRTYDCKKTGTDA